MLACLTRVLRYPDNGIGDDGACALATVLAQTRLTRLSLHGKRCCAACCISNRLLTSQPRTQTIALATWAAARSRLCCHTRCWSLVLVRVVKRLPFIQPAHLRMSFRSSTRLQSPGARLAAHAVRYRQLEGARPCAFPRPAARHHCHSADSCPQRNPAHDCALAWVERR